MPSPEQSPKWYHNIWFVLFMLLFVLGPFGLPLVWKNPTLSRPVKLTLTLVTAIFTVALIHGTIRMANAVMQNVHQLDQLYQ